MLAVLRAAGVGQDAGSPLWSLRLRLPCCRPLLQRSRRYAVLAWGQFLTGAAAQMPLSAVPIFSLQRVSWRTRDLTRLPARLTRSCKPLQ